MAGRLIILCGLPGSGKTTLAVRLSAEYGAFRLDADEWLLALGFGLFDEAARERIERLQWALARKLLEREQIVVVEWGAWSRAERDRLRMEAREQGAVVELRVLEAPLDELLLRIQSRNRDVPPITREDLAQWNVQFEQPNSEELAMYDSPICVRE